MRSRVHTFGLYCIWLVISMQKTHISVIKMHIFPLLLSILHTGTSSLLKQELQKVCQLPWKQFFFYYYSCLWQGKGNLNFSSPLVSLFFSPGGGSSSKESPAVAPFHCFEPGTSGLPHIHTWTQTDPEHREESLHSSVG